MTKRKLALLLATTALTAMPLASTPSHAQTAPIVVAQQREEPGPEGKPKQPPKEAPRGAPPARPGAPPGGRDLAERTGNRGQVPGHALDAGTVEVGAIEIGTDGRPRLLRDHQRLPIVVPARSSNYSNA